MKILLNQWDDPRLSEQVWVGKGDKVYANYGAEEFGFTVGKEYIIQGIDGDLVMENDSGEIDGYSSEYFTNYEPI